MDFDSNFEPCAFSNLRKKLEVLEVEKHLERLSHLSQDQEI